MFIGPPDNDSMSESPEHLIRDGEYGNMARLETDKKSARIPETKLNFSGAVDDAKCLQHLTLGRLPCLLQA